jgi:peptidoglycan hydrolase CwlO-like protein
MDNSLTNRELLLNIQKSLHSIHKKIDRLQDDINTTKKQVLEINFRFPERQDGYLFGGYWKTKKPELDGLM